MAEDHHAVLGIRADASRNEILQAYSELVKEFHPDHNHDDPDAEKKFIRIQRSFEMLYEPERHQAAGVFHTRLSAFLRVWCLHDSIRRVPYSGDFRLPVIAMATVFYSFLIIAIFVMRRFASATTGNTILWPTYATTEPWGTYVVMGITLVYIAIVVAVLLKNRRR